ncbi:hypothetical protein CcaverHIS002_0113190 [Cutaneotrichosporon cavernicola]|uniref:Phytanoyl-CoA dioxygenase n=1 Tax=Cutaneotrichosporon cavernicola TaxID=279322 RepID=A0AA48IEP8_9TREE|nr:uncharacterized protein CcaverHIS019_0113060 [Cutaneotrichosporon cavernicola]BEI80790.1 hypothetical protein CcaverHIS002_0113190 [Cutaneotrichosporon cavernicola]BEI88588.1 hypothetical protein CcaverHIS019_0113060 [Cutaneotrichosporon cavernicola]BEI96361.1 hypothetical protein CcaverHIS631_0113100 [Cutaneotrichosporon cavernicola]
MRGMATSPQTVAPPLVAITPSRQEISAARLDARSIQRALEALSRDGIVVVEDVVDHDAIDALNAVMVKDAATLIARGTHGPFNYNLGNLQQSPPFDSAVFAPNIFVNPIATQITNAFLGERPTMSFLSSNVAVKADQGQPVHSDADFDYPSIPFAAVVNVGLVDMRPENGSTQLWLGTHNADISAQMGVHGDRDSGRIKDELLAGRAKVRPPIQPTIKKGSIVVRDLRLWHAGMPNRTDNVRVMLAMIHFAPWYRQRMTLRLPRTLRHVLDGNPRLAVSVDWVDEDIDHLNMPFGNAFDFSQDK